MGRIIYSLTIQMFALTDEYQIPDTVLTKVRDFNLFHVVNYLEPWYTATEPLTGPLTDLNLLKKIAEYQSLNRKVAKVALDSFKNHLWYLSPHCVPLALFDKRVADDTKRAIVGKLGHKVVCVPIDLYRYYD
ncbi:uncharacterized protein LOC127750535 [Frankliniella occidentalis]|uniref:Uncharacterized protein LOC127750535 n=1 Tax=Frankliniella occidentalis TaxID=133901 RepID=A0A9C6XRI5_FRAOC|nr:uncharacterized protein LOC127750535 [Frankliniella occidentalis]